MLFAFGLPVNAVVAAALDLVALGFLALLVKE
jgi:hypothetical protein